MSPEGAGETDGEPSLTEPIVAMQDAGGIQSDSGISESQSDAMGSDDDWVDESDEEDNIGEAILGWVDRHLGVVLLAVITHFGLLLLLSIALLATPGSAHASINYASYNEGARTLLEFMSTTHRLPFWTCAIIWAAQYGDNYVDVSNEVLNDEVNVSHCWPFWGSSGHVAIFLSQRVEVKRMRISHVQDDSSLSEALRQAPRDIALWGLRTDLNLTTFRPATDFTTAAGATDVPLFELLGRYTFNAKSFDQWFEVENPNTVGYSTVLVEILTNWGGGSTCVYIPNPNEDDEDGKSLQTD
ncbi:hypothetical protein BDN71DRAFT_1510923 [Pleurotus eryngii]|uniref:SUN domain-containing protein n=1 Tax=Pleurotus eryngii TaxID=5323 RepID=A0A9P5ZNV9_PLEER|nr:hypothetical protein BDN71DRAFT_1510923 [Pleurotus eryngii]